MLYQPCLDHPAMHPPTHTLTVTRLSADAEPCVVYRAEVRSREALAVALNGYVTRRLQRGWRVVGKPNADQLVCSKQEEGRAVVLRIDLAEVSA